MIDKNTSHPKMPRLGRDLEKTLQEIKEEPIPERLLELARQLQTQLRLRSMSED